jgi:capsular exopolysaccharide synthesis family protein
VSGDLDPQEGGVTVHQTIEAPQAANVTYSFSDELIILSDPHGQGAEYIRALRTQIMAQHLEAGRRALAICEAAPRLGATFVAANLALSLAQAGVDTVLIDGNLRAPSLQNLIRPSRELPGLRNCLSSTDRAVGDYVQEDILPNFSVIFSGGAALNAQELLARGSFEQVIKTCMRDFTMTIIDTPPGNSCADCRRIASVAGYSMIVTRRHKGLVEDVKTLAGQLRAAHSTVIGTVLNDG